MDIAHQNILSAENICKRYVSEGENLEVLKGASIALDAGDMAVLLGDSGTGKSTFLHILGTLDKPNDGRVMYKGVDVTTFDTHKLAEFRNRKVGFVYQFHHLLPEFTALENVMMPGLIEGLDRQPASDRAERLLDSVGLKERVKHHPSQLSGGEAQRVAIARALFNKPEVIYADEPTGNLDVKTGDRLMDLFEKLNEDLGQTFLVATHNQRLSERTARRFLIRNGVIENLA
jgi:lipoprotein-releasing system ATP-binding protein